MLPVDYRSVEFYNEITLSNSEIPLPEKILFTILRVDPKSVPKGLYVYDIRHSDEDWGEPATIEPKVIVNHMGAIITNEEIKFPNPDDTHPYINIDKYRIGSLLTVDGTENIQGLYDYFGIDKPQ